MVLLPWPMLPGSVTEPSAANSACKPANVPLAVYPAPFPQSERSTQGSTARVDQRYCISPRIGQRRGAAIETEAIVAGDSGTAIQLEPLRRAIRRLIRMSIEVAGRIRAQAIKVIHGMGREPIAAQIGGPLQDSGAQTKFRQIKT